jgi:ABC-type branched-subunit amino acid transport system substrate-binding protein
MNVRTLRLGAGAIVLAVLGAACSTAGTSNNASTTGAPGSGATGGALTASARGVTPTSIKIGFSYIDLEALAKSGIIKIDHGPYEQIIQALVDDVNARGGINGRKLELVTAKYSPIGNDAQLAACTKLTEDDKVFAVLNGLLADNNLCITQQHSTILVSGTGLNAAHLAAARAPWATYGASDERSIAALVKALDQNGELTGHKVGIYAAQAAYKPLIDVAKQAMQAAGHDVTDTALMDAPGADVQAATAQDKVIAARFQNEGIDTIINVGQFIPGADFDTAGYHPRMFSLVAGNVAAAAFTNPLGKFPVVGGLAGAGNPYTDSAEFKRCRDVWKAKTGKDIKTEVQEDLDGKSSGYVAMSIACTTLQIFVAAAKAAGPDLTNESWQKGLESLGKIQLASVLDSSFGPNKHDAQDSFQLEKIDPTWKAGQGKQQFIDIGQPVTLGG